MNLITQQEFESLSKTLFAALEPYEYITLSLLAEKSQFIRFNRSKVRQMGTVSDCQITLQYIVQDKELEPETNTPSLKASRIAQNLTGKMDEDLSRLLTGLKSVRALTQTLRPDPFAILPRSKETSTEIFEGRLLPIDEAVDTIAPLLCQIDLTGIYAGGSQIRGNANSLGQNHWFCTENFSFDYSIYTESEKAVKGLYGGKEWCTDVLIAQLEEAKSQLDALERPVKKLLPGSYRVYFAPSAVHGLVEMFSWSFLGEQAIQTKQSALTKVKSGERSFSTLFSLEEDFSSGECPRFNELGEVGPVQLSLIEQGQFKSSLVSTRSALQFKTESNQAPEGENLRAPILRGGYLKSDQILERLGTGVFISNLHYLNWSDPQEARITGMTRYACFWVENGKLVAPIENMRFDDTLFNVFGAELEDLTRTIVTFPATGTYFSRQLGAAKTPGALVKKFNFVL